MKRIRLIALDLDGTLFDRGGRMGTLNREMLRAWNGRGAMIALASGRMTDRIRPAGRELGVDCAVLAYNGAMVLSRETNGGKVLFHRPLASGIGDEVIDYCAANRFQLNYYLDDVLYSEESQELRPFAELYARRTGSQFHFLDSLARLKGKEPTKLILIADTAGPDPLRTRNGQYEVMMQRMDGRAALVRTDPEYLEFLHCGANKGVGLERLAVHYGISREEIIAFGDGENDIEMLRYAGTGVALANAKESVKAAADVVLEWSNEEQAVGRYLETLAA